MNDLFLSCLECREYAPTAYKWTLCKFREIGYDINAGPQSIDPEIALKADIWEVPAGSDHDWIRPINNDMISFIRTHSDHGDLIYSDRYEFEEDEEYWWSDKAGHDWFSTARYFIEKYAVNSMDDVLSLAEAGVCTPIWYNREDDHVEYSGGRARFEAALLELIAGME